MAQHKRSHDEFSADDGGFAAGDTLPPVNESSKRPTIALDGANGSHPSAADNTKADGDGDWQVAESHRSKKRKKVPKKDSDNYPSITHSAHARLQSYVKIGDLQNLVLYLLADGTSPQWCAVRHHGHVRKVVCLMVPGLESGMFNGKLPLSPVEVRNGVPADGNGDAGNSSEVAVDVQEEEIKPSNAEAERSLRISPDDYYPVKLLPDRIPGPLRPLAEIFDHIWPVKTPGEDRNARMHSPLAAMLTVPLQKSKEEKKTKGPQFPPEGKNWRNQRIPVAELLASTQELAGEGYAMHPAHYTAASAEAEQQRRQDNKQTAEHGWLETRNIPDLASGKDESQKDNYPLQGRDVIAMDCEMCITSPKGVTPQVFSLTRVSVIDWDGKVILDELVKPADPITDYLTPYSGITEQLLEGVTTTLQDVQQKLLSIITPRTILIGHSLNSDLNALKLTHPFIVDTAFLYPHPRGPPLKSSLKWLSQKYLAREIQKGHGTTGHSSVEDAKACLDLVKQKCEKGKLWGTSEASGEPIFKRLGRAKRSKKEKFDPSGDDESKIGAVVDWGEPSRGFGGSARVAIGCQSDEQVVAGVKRAVAGDDDDAVVPRGGCDFTWARLRELEAHRGWWNRSKTVDNEALLAGTQSSPDTLEDAVAKTVSCIREIYEALPACTALVVYSGSGDPRDLSQMQALQQKFKEEYRVKKWDQLSVRWTDVEEQKLKKACEQARRGVGFVTVK